MKIDFYPYISQDNLYLSIIIENIRNEKCEVTPFVVSLKEWGLRKRQADVVHFNWFDNIDSSTFIKTILRLIKRILIIKILKFRGVKIVTTVHNRLPHNTRYKFLSFLFLKILYRNADVITVLTNSTRDVLREQLGDKFYNRIENKIVFIPHPNYIGAYPQSTKQLIGGTREKNRMRFLFLGAVKPYKNIELILEVAKYFSQNKFNAEFVIAGNGKKEYLNLLKSHYSNMENVVFIDKFIANEEIDGLVKEADIFILPYDKKSSLNSGTCYLAFSYKKNVICPDISTIIDIGKEKCYAYSYETERNHLEQLLSMSIKAYEDFTKDKALFIKKGEDLFDLVAQNNSPKDIGKMYRDIYVKLVEK